MTDLQDTTGTADELSHVGTPTETPAAVQEAAVVAGEPAEVVERGSGDASVPRRPWKSVAGMRRSKLFKRQIGELLTPEYRDAIVQEIMDRVAPRYAEDLSKRQPEGETLAARLPGDRSIFDAHRRSNVVPLSRHVAEAEAVRAYWIERLSKANTERLALHQQLALVEREINAAQQMLDTTRFPPNGPAAA